MRLLVDMNMSPQWIAVLADAGLEAVHWSTLGRADASDDLIMNTARLDGYSILTHDLGAMLATTGDHGPSVIQLRDQDILPGASASTVIEAIWAAEADLEAGALVTIDAARFRVTLLPLLRK